ncbi:uncharacterized protein LOC143468510 [Clavelina lepadiformis]|uniref:uncharacterized protein LOC143468510 n=1 Tax=Clavelina lepadiformis TaxID=159417 RepID=UPI0040420A0B
MTSNSSAQDHVDPSHQVIGSAVTLTISLVVNGVVVYGLLTLRPRYRFPRSERILLLSLAISGVGVGFFGAFPTLLAASIKPDSLQAGGCPYQKTDDLCQVFGMLGIIFMTSSSWFAALLSLNRYVIITRVFQPHFIRSYKRLSAITGTILLIIVTFYVILWLMVNEGVGVNDVSQFDWMKYSNESYVECAEVPSIEFLAYDRVSAITCGPNWRILPNYLLAAMVVFFVAPLFCVLVSYALITRVAYKQIGQIRKDAVQHPADNDERRISHSVVTNQASSPDPTHRKSSVRRGSTSQTTNNDVNYRVRSRMASDSSVGRRKANFSFFIVIFAFLVTWAPYIAYFLVESETFYDYFQEQLNNQSGSNWTSSFQPPIAYMMTWSGLFGRSWSVLVYAILNRKLRHAIEKKLKNLSPRNLKRVIYMKLGIRGNKISPTSARGKTGSILTLSQILNQREDKRESSSELTTSRAFACDVSAPPNVASARRWKGKKVSNYWRKCEIIYEL